MTAKKRISTTGSGSAFKIHPKAIAPTNYREAYQSPAERARLAALWRDMLNAGFLYASHGLGLLSTPMTELEVDSFVAAFAHCAAKHRD
jgi:glutamate-1-semialdehyde 2,1-aminomutase